MFSNYKHNLFENYKNIVEKVIPTLKDNNFSKTGMLTPDEFVEAGNYLIKNNSSWKWYGNITNKKMNFLPNDKQMLINNGIKCNKIKNITLELDENDINNITIQSDINTPSESESDNDEIDLSDFELDNIYEPDILNIKQPIKNNKENVNKYNLSITYDNYFRTPRLWLIGFDHNNIPLSNNKIFSDISIEHSKITVTIEQHPFYNDMNYISIHPCKHSHMIKRLIEEEKKNNKEINVHEYFIYFLKFFSTIIPNLDYCV
jgi:ubiquitin-like-conjugating enzyme ATG3